jgi:hypothetical protein
MYVRRESLKSRRCRLIIPPFEFIKKGGIMSNEMIIEIGMRMKKVLFYNWCMCDDEFWRNLYEEFLDYMDYCLLNFDLDYDDNCDILYNEYLD